MKYLPIGRYSIQIIDTYIYTITVCHRLVNSMSMLNSATSRISLGTVQGYIVLSIGQGYPSPVKLTMFGQKNLGIVTNIHKKIVINLQEQIIG